MHKYCKATAVTVTTIVFNPECLTKLNS